MHKSDVIIVNTSVIKKIQSSRTHVVAKPNAARESLNISYFADNNIFFFVTVLYKQVAVSVFKLEMMRLEDMESAFPLLRSNLQALKKRAVILKDYQPCAFNTLRRIKKSTQNHPLSSLFLVIFILLGFIPLMVVTAFVSSSSLVVVMSAIMVFGGTFAAAFASLFVVMFPVLMFGSGVVVLMYFTYCAVMSILQVFKRLENIVKSFVHFKKNRQQSHRIDASHP